VPLFFAFFSITLLCLTLIFGEIFFSSQKRQPNYSFLTIADFLTWKIKAKCFGNSVWNSVGIWKKKLFSGTDWDFWKISPNGVGGKVMLLVCGASGLGDESKGKTHTHTTNFQFSNNTNTQLF